MTKWTLTPALVLLTSAVYAAPLPIVEYYGKNGDNSYRDNSYTGTGGGTGYANLSGGTGDLTDNAASTDWSQATWVGWDQSNGGFGANPVTTTFDLGGVYLVQQTQIDLAQDLPPSIRVPETITVSFSTDNVTFGNPVVHDPGSPAGTVYRTDTVNSSQVARYVRIESTFKAFGGDNWIFYNNVRFDGSPIPEPASLALLAAGTGLLVTRRRA